MGVCGSGPKIEIDPIQPLTPPCPSNIVHKDKEWNKDKLKWQCKMDNCTIAYATKWLLTKHLKEVHGLVVEKTKPGRPSTFKGGHGHQYHVKMNVHILGEVMAMQRWNDRKVINRACAKAQCKWDELIIVAQQCPPLPKPTLIVVLYFHESRMIHGR